MKLFQLAALVCLAAVATVASPLADDGVFHSAKLIRHDHEGNEHDGPLLHHSFVAPLNHNDNADSRTFIYVSVAEIN